MLKFLYILFIMDLLIDSISWIQTETWNPEPSMIESRSNAACAMFEGDDSIWWVTGGTAYGDNTTEVFHVANESFSFGVDMPQGMSSHDLVNVNETHMFYLGDHASADEIFMFDR